MNNLLNKYNKTTPRFTFRTPDNFEYVNLKRLVDLYGIKQEHVLNALYINTKSRYGNSPVAVTGTHLVNLPGHLLDTVTEMMNDPEFVEAVNKHLIGFTIYEYEGRNGKGYSVNWVSMDL